MKKKFVAVAMVLVLALTAVIGGSFAYFTDTEAATNVMVMGNIDISQLEYERVVDANGNWIPTNTTDKYGYTPDELQEFVQEKPLYPAVFADGTIKWDDRTSDHQQSWGQLDAPGSNQLFDDSVKNAIDKFVFVKNESGHSDAYVRTIFAFEQGDLTAAEFDEIIGTSADANHWDWETIATDVEIDGQKYVIATATYMGPTSDPTGILPADSVSYPSLLQVYMVPETTQEQVTSFGGTYEILVLSQAVQTEGFADAETALNTAFGKPGDTAANGLMNAQAWFYEANGAVLVESAEDLQETLTNGGSAVLTKDVVLTENLPMNGGVLNGNGKTITAGSTGYDCAVTTTGGMISDLTITGSADATRAIGSGSTGDHVLTEDLHISNVRIDKVMYAINGGADSSANVSVYVNDSVVYGWISYAGLEQFEFNNCTIGKGDSYDGYMVVYGNTRFNGCTFEEFDMCAADSVPAGSQVEFNGCTNDGVQVTAENFKTLFMYPGDEVDFNKLQSCTVVVDGVEVQW